jgi:hypothetical protein
MRLRLRVLILAELAVWAGRERFVAADRCHPLGSTISVTVDVGELTGINFDPAAVMLA